MPHMIWTPATPGPAGRLGELDLSASGRQFVARTLGKNGMAGWQTATTAALLTSWDLTDPRNFFDVGANIGIYSFLHNQLWPRGTTIAFEPTPDLVDRAKSTMRANDLTVTWETAAVSDSDGEATLYLSSRSDASNSLVEGYRPASKAIAVPTTTLDSYVRRTGVVPSVIKIDVENHEPGVIQGAEWVLREHRPVVITELLPNRRNADRAREMLSEHGYDSRHLTAPELAPGQADRDWLFWPGGIPAEFDHRFHDWLTTVARCVPR